MARIQRGPVISSPVFQMADRLMSGKLADRLLTHRAAGRSFEEISRRLYDEAGVSISAKTLAAWVKRLTPSDDEAA